MINSSNYLNFLQKSGVDFFCGVPDSLMKDLLGCIQEKVPSNNHVITANEGSAVALASGYHLATNKIAMVYLQNSGLGNCINPLLSLASPDVYGIPMVVMVGWRGEPGVKDEPQHVHQGRVTPSLIESMGFKYFAISENDDDSLKATDDAIKLAKNKSEPVFLLVKKGSFEKFQSKKVENSYKLSREEAIEHISKEIPEHSIVLSTTGKISRELYESRVRNSSPTSDFYNVGSMGHLSQIALGVSLFQKEKPIFCIDGDGAFIMHMGGNLSIGSRSPENLCHIILNNEAHESVGGQPTDANNLDFEKVGTGLGYKNFKSCQTLQEISNALSAFNKGPMLIEVKVAAGSRSDLGRPTTTPKENKVSFQSKI